MPPSYPPPVDRLLTLGETDSWDDWPDFPALGLGAEHVPELIRLVCDRELLLATGDRAEIWAPIHAWRALGQLRAADAVEPLLELLGEADEWEVSGLRRWAYDEFPELFFLIGAAAVPALIRFLLDPSHDEDAREAAVLALTRIAEADKEVRDESVSALARLLDSEESEPWLNAAVIRRLIELKAVEAASAMERAFAEGRVGPWYQGDWEDVQVALGLIPERVTPRRQEPVRLSATSGGGGWGPLGERRSRAERDKKKAKRKAEKASRRRNRRR